MKGLLIPHRGCDPQVENYWPRGSCIAYLVYVLEEQSGMVWNLLMLVSMCTTKNLAVVYFWNFPLISF